MAAVLQPHHLPSPSAPRRPDLRVLAGGGRPARPHSAGGGLSAAAVVAGLVLLVVLVSAVLGIGRGAFAGLAPASPASPASASPAAAAPAAGTATVVVRPGDTLWSIARQLQPNGDVRPLVDRLVAANGSSVVAPGDRVAIPR